MPKKEIVPYKNKESLPATVDSFQAGLAIFLQDLGLPHENVLVEIDERKKVLANIPAVTEMVQADIRIKSLYLSKFLAAVGAGLFDAALNFIWDETIQNLRRKVALFDLEYFYDSVITDPVRRSKLSTEEDLISLDDWELIRGCHLTGILSDIGFRHLDYIRNMRNWASAAHPNQVQLTGFQLISWLETCIKEVIGKEPSAPAIEVRRLLNNIRTQVITASDVKPIADSIEKLSTDLVTSLIRTVFGMFCDPRTAVQIKNNIRLIAKAVWDRSPDDVRKEIGIKYATHAANADISRRDAGKDFLTTVEGLTYLPKDTLAVEMTETLNALYLAHTGFNNFYNEPAHAKILFRYVPDNGKIPDEIRPLYVKTIIMCFIGNGYGISSAAYEYYRELVIRFQDKEIYQLLLLMKDREFSSRLQFDSCRKRFKKYLLELKDMTASSQLLKGIEFLLKQTDEQLPNVGKTSEYIKILNK